MDRASAGLESVISKALHQAPVEDSALLAWPIVCGSAVAERTRAVSFSGGIVGVEVGEAGWQREVASVAARYLAAINRYTAAGVERIEFVVKAVR